MRSPLLLGVVISLALAGGRHAHAQIAGEPWRMHVIDDDGRGSDGTKLADINGDGRPDITTAWEEDGSTRVYLNPGPALAGRPWPKAIVGRTPSAEDSLFVDLDGDGRFDVLSATEGKTRQVFVHWSPTEPQRLLEPSGWKQESLPAASGITAWMFAQAMDVDDRNGVDVIIGGKATTPPNSKTPARSMLAWLEAPRNARDLSQWKLHPLIEAGWIMSIELADMDHDGDRDILYSDRYGATRGVYWLENPGASATAQGAPWKKHPVGALDADQVMFLTLGDLNGDKLQDIAVGIRNGVQGDSGERPDLHSRIMLFLRRDPPGERWDPHPLQVPANAGNIKGLAIGDIDEDGKPDMAASSEGANGERIGVYWLRQGRDFKASTWEARNISGAPGIKFDLVHLLDLDGDGDLDLLTNEERENRTGLGVVWYENPRRRTR